MIVTLDIPSSPFHEALPPGYFKAVPHTIGATEAEVDAVNENRAPLESIHLLARQLQSAAFALNVREVAGTC